MESRIRSCDWRSQFKRKKRRLLETDSVSLAAGAKNFETGLQIRLFGPMEVRVGGRPLPRLRSRKGLWLLANLTLRAGRDVDRDWLADTLWPESEEIAARRSFRQSLHDLRAALGEEAWRLHGEAPRTLRVDLAGADVDLLEWDRLSTCDDLPSLSACLDLYRGPLLEGCAEEWVVEERGRREAIRTSLLQRAAELARLAGDTAIAAGFLRQAVAADPYREEMWRELMQALADAGDTSGALHAYRELRALLRSELLDGPGPETEELYNAVRGAARERAPTPRPLPSPAGPPVRQAASSLPTPSTELIGRTESVRQVRRLLADRRLVTLTGTGGIGKTRLSIEVARESQEVFDQGTEFVALTAVTDPDAIATVVREGLRIAPRAGASDPVANLCRSIGSRSMLLILDNCEHLIAACARVAERLIRDCPKLRILATSRQTLGVDGEAVMRVPSLAVPSADRTRSLAAPTEGAPSEDTYASVRLFLQRARAVRNDFSPHDDELSIIADICRRLDGLPLAIELVASRAGALSLAEMRERLLSGSELATGVAVAPGQRTLEAAFRWSWDLLGERERSTLARASVFRGTWAIEAARAVCGGEGVEPEDVGSLLMSLGDRSLLVSLPEPGRFGLLETIRHFARERLHDAGEEELRRDLHLGYYLALCEEAEPHLTAPEAPQWLDRLEMEHNNLNAALDWTCEKPDGAEEGLRLAAAVWRFWEVRGHFREGCRRVASLRGLPARDYSTEARAKALQGAGHLAFRLGDYAADRSAQEESLSIYRKLENRLGTAAALNDLGNSAALQGDRIAAKGYYAESLAIRRELDDQRGVAVTLNNLGNIANDECDFATAKRVLEESLRIRREIGDERGSALALSNLAITACQEHNFEAALRLHLECLALQRKLGNRRGIASSLCNLGVVHNASGEHASAEPLLLEGLSILWEVGDLNGVASALEALANARGGVGAYREVARLLSCADRLREEIGAPLPPNEGPLYNRIVAEAREAIGAEAFDAVWAQARTRKLEEVVAAAIGAA